MAEVAQMITEEHLTDVEGLFTDWDLPLVIMFATRNNSIGIVDLPNVIYARYPDPIDVVQALADARKINNSTMRSQHQPYQEKYPDEFVEGEPWALIVVVESWGMVKSELQTAQERLGPDNVRALIEEHGRFPVSLMPEAREQRNVISLEWDGTFSTFVRYRDVNDTEFFTSRGEGAPEMGGRLADAMKELVEAVKDSWQWHREFQGGMN